MKKIDPIQQLNVNIDGTDYPLLRQEILKDDELGHILTTYERLLNEISELEYETSKLIHAKRSMNAALQNRALAYMQAKVKGPEENPDESVEKS